MGAIANMIRAGVDPDLIEQLFYERSLEPAKPRPMTAAERQAKKRAADKASRDAVTTQEGASRSSRENVTEQREGRHESHENRDPSCGREIENTNLDSRLPSEASLPQDAGASDPLDENPKQILFDGGLRWLQQVSGKGDPACRRMLGKWLSTIGGDDYASQLVGILRDAKIKGKADPIGWISAMVNSRRPRAGPSRNSGHFEAIKDDLRGGNDGNHEISEPDALDPEPVKRLAGKHDGFDAESPGGDEGRFYAAGDRYARRGAASRDVGSLGDLVAGIAARRPGIH